MVTDSACSLPDDLALARGVRVVPMWLSVGGRQYRDGELPLEQVVACLGEGLSTSGPAPGELAGAAEEADEGDGVLVLTISRRMSGAYQAARVAAATLADAGGKEVAVVDTGTAAGAQGLVVLAASRAARAGLPLGDVVAAAEVASREARLVATLPSLQHLARGGRVPGAAAWGAEWLGLNPVFEFRGGHVRPLRPARGRQAAFRRVVAAWRRGSAEHVRRGQALHVAALHALDPLAAEDLAAQVGARVSPQTAFVGSFSAVMVAHTGPGLAGLAWQWETTAPRPG
ncbi:MAG: DegV family protein [Acidimicrobiales bacterium]